MRTRFFKIAAVLLIVITLCSCGSKSTTNVDPLEGYWMDEQGNTATFTGDSSVLWYGNDYTYTIYDTNKVLIKNGNAEVGNYKFDIKSDTLELEDLKYKVVSTFYRNESKQEKILDDIRKAENEQMEADAKAEKE